MSIEEIKNGLIITEDGTRLWYKENLLHREGEPAIEWPDGDKYWYKEGLRHREDGPAVEWSDGNKKWFLNDKEMTSEEFKHYMDMKRLNKDLHLKLPINNKAKLSKI